MPTKMIVIHYQDTDPAESIAEIPPHVILARRGQDGAFAQVGGVAGGDLPGIVRMTGVCATMRPSHELFGEGAFSPPHMFNAESFFAAPKNFIGYYPQFVGLADEPDVDWNARYSAFADGQDDSYPEDACDALTSPGIEVFGYGLPIHSVTVQNVDELPRVGERAPIVED